MFETFSLIFGLVSGCVRGQHKYINSYDPSYYIGEGACSNKLQTRDFKLPSFLEVGNTSRKRNGHTIDL